MHIGQKSEVDLCPNARHDNQIGALPQLLDYGSDYSNNRYGS